LYELEFYAMLDGAYPYVPPTRERRSNFIDLPNRHFDPILGQRVIQDQIGQLEFCEYLGFDGVLWSEQHSSPIGLQGNVLVGAAYLAARTSKIRLAAVGPLLNAYLTPLRLAEEAALVDLLSGGRLTLGLPMGIGAQYHGYGVMNPALARERFLEAHALFVKALTEDGPFEWKGKYFHQPYVNLWCKPLQQPYFPIFIPAAGSRESLALTARYHYTYQAVLTPRKVLLGNCERFLDLCRQEGYEADRRQIAAVIHVHVSETDGQARREAEAHLLWQYQNFFRSPFPDSFPFGHVSVESLRGMAAGAGYRSRPLESMQWDDLLAEGWLVAGSPDTVASRLRELTEEMHAGRVICTFNAGTMDRWLMNKSMTLFAEHVAPRFRPGGLPIWERERAAGPTSVSEAAARVPPDALMPMALKDGEYIDVRTAHLGDLRPGGER